MQNLAGVAIGAGIAIAGVAVAVAVYSSNPAPAPVAAPSDKPFVGFVTVGGILWRLDQRTGETQYCNYTTEGPGCFKAREYSHKDDKAKEQGPTLTPR